MRVLLLRRESYQPPPQGEHVGGGRALWMARNIFHVLASCLHTGSSLHGWAGHIRVWPKATLTDVHKRTILTITPLCLVEREAQALAIWSDLVLTDGLQDTLVAFVLAFSTTLVVELCQSLGASARF